MLEAFLSNGSLILGTRRNLEEIGGSGFPRLAQMVAALNLTIAQILGLSGYAFPYH